MLRRAMVLAVLAALVAAPGVSRAALECGPDTAFENDDVRVWFQGFKGHVKVFDKADEGNGNDGMYQFKTAALTEYDGEEPVASMHLGHAFPQSTDVCTVEIETETDEDGNTTEVGRVITWTLTGPVRATDGGEVGETTVTMRWHFRTEDNGTKFDLFVDEWPWQGTGELAFAFDVTSSGGFEEAENGLGIRNNAGEPSGHISWDAEFTARYDDDSEQTGTVDASSQVDGNTASVELRFTGVEDGYVELIYDPWVGVGSYVVLGPLLIGDSTIQGLLRRVDL